MAESPQETRDGREPLVRFAAITKRYGGVVALDAVSTEFHPGSIVGLVGDNGAGKSTLVKIISGLTEPDEGDLWVAGDRVIGLTPAEAHTRGIETVHQNLLLCDNLSAAENMMLGREPIQFRIGPLSFIDKAAIVRNTVARIREVGVALPDVSSPVRVFSGGQRQAVAIARAFDVGCRVLLLDEPTAALGVRQTAATLDLVKRVADRDVAVVMISHNIEDVFRVATRIVAMRQGRIVLDKPIGATSRPEVIGAMTGILQ